MFASKQAKGIFLTSAREEKTKTSCDGFMLNGLVAPKQAPGWVCES